MEQGKTVSQKFEVATKAFKVLTDYMPRLSKDVPNKVQYPTQCGAVCEATLDADKKHVYNSLWRKFEAWCTLVGGPTGLLRQGSHSAR